MGTAAQFGGMGMKAGSAYTSAMAQQGANRANAQIAEYQAGQAIQNGQTNVGTSRLRVAQVKGEQRAALAANGVDLGEGSATDVLASTDMLGDRDAATIMDNALRTAWGYQVQEAQYKNANRNIHPGLDFFSSIFGSATSTQGQQAFNNLGQNTAGASGGSAGGSGAGMGMNAWAGSNMGGSAAMG